jgi:perosamine synthetase
MTATAARVPLAKPLIGPDEHAAVAQVLATGLIAQGAEVAAFEEEFSQHVGGRPCVAVSSGTSALQLALEAMGIGPGDEVIVPAFTFAASASAVLLARARPVFVDIEPEQFCIDPQSIEAAIGPRTAAIIAVHLYGHPAPMDQVMAIAERHGLSVLEDAAQAHLAGWRSKPVGTFGKTAAFSFYPTKNMTTGEGGLIVCANEEIQRRVRLLRNHGMTHRRVPELVGQNARMTDLNAAIGRVQLRRLPEWTTARRDNAARLSAELEARCGSAIGIPRVAEGAEPVWHQYTVRVAHREQIARSLADSGIGSAVHYPYALHQLRSFRAAGCGCVDNRLPVSEQASREVLSLPVHPALSYEDIDDVVAAMCKAVSLWQRCALD